MNISFCFSQNNISLFAEDQTIWSVGEFVMNPSIPWSVYFIKVDGQVLIDNVEYFQIKSSQYNTDISDDWDLNCYVRVSEDSLLYVKTLEGVEKKIFNYKLKYGESEECWIYDFFAEVFRPINITIQEVNNYTNSGFTYTRWKIVNNLEDVGPFTTWTTNIGCLEGILRANLELDPVTGRKDIVLCSWLNGLQIYSNENFDFCEIVAKKNVKNTEFVIYPNPTNNKICLNINNCNLLGEIYKIYNLTGQCVMSGSVNELNMTISLENLCTGIYVFKFANTKTMNIIKK